MVNKFTTYNGTFVCQNCGTSVYSLRLWSDTLDLTWFCENKHTSRVSLYKKGRS
jgi:hypothetical protein